MPRMTHNFIVTLHKAPAANEPFRWLISDAVQVTAMDKDTAERLARRALGLDSTWCLRECQDQGAWNKVL